MNKYILALVLVAAVGAIVSEAGSFGENGLAYEDEVLTEEEDRTLSEEEDESTEVAVAAPTFIQNLRKLDVVAILRKSDEVETAELRNNPEDFEKYEKFCYTVRDEVNQWVSDAVNNRVSSAMHFVGTLFFDTATLFGNEGNKAVAKGSELVKQDIGKFVDGLQVILDVLKQTILDKRTNVVENFQKGVNMDTVEELMEEACTAAQKKKKEIDNKFGSRKWTELGCVTLKRVKITDRICSLFIALKPFLHGFSD